MSEYGSRETWETDLIIDAVQFSVWYRGEDGTKWKTTCRTLPAAFRLASAKDPAVIYAINTGGRFFALAREDYHKFAEAWRYRYGEQSDLSFLKPVPTAGTTCAGCGRTGGKLAVFQSKSWHMSCWRVMKLGERKVS